MRNFLLLILLFFAGSWLSRKLRQAHERAARNGATGPTDSRASGYHGARPSSNRPASLPEPMVCCAMCGVHTPKSDAVLVDGEYFCSAEHAAHHAASASRDVR